MVIYSEQCLMQRSNVNVGRHLKGPCITQIPDADCCLTHNCPQSIPGALGLASLYGKISVHGKIIFLASITDLMPSHKSFASLPASRISCTCDWFPRYDTWLNHRSRICASKISVLVVYSNYLSSTLYFFPI